MARIEGGRFHEQHQGYRRRCLNTKELAHDQVAGTVHHMRFALNWLGPGPGPELALEPEPELAPGLGLVPGPEPEQPELAPARLVVC